MLLPDISHAIKPLKQSQRWSGQCSPISVSCQQWKDWSCPSQIVILKRMKSITRCDGGGGGDGGKYYICNCWSGMRMLIISPLASGPSPDDRQRLQRVRPGPAIIRKFSDSDSVSRYHYLFSWLLLPLKVLGPEQAAGPPSDSGDMKAAVPSSVPTN